MEDLEFLYLCNFWNFGTFWNCWIFLCSVEFVLRKENLESTAHLHNFQINSKVATLNPLGFGILGCGFVIYCFVLWSLYCLKRIKNPRKIKNFELMFKCVCLYNVCLCHFL